MKSIIFVLGAMNSGGIEKALVNFIKQFDRSKYDITVLLLKKEGIFLNDLSHCKIIEMPLLEKERDALLRGGFKYSLLYYFKKLKFISLAKIIFKRIILHKNNFENVRSIKKIEGISITYDYAVCYTAHFPILLEYTSLKINAKTKYLWIHNDFVTTKYRIDREKDYLEKYDKFFAVSKQLKKEFIDILPVYADKTFVFYNYLDKQSITSLSSQDVKVFDDNRLHLLTIGRLVYQKGFDIAIEVANLLKGKNLNFYWIFVGEGPLYQQIYDKVKEYDLSEYIKLYGTTNNPYALIKKCDIYVQPSRHEGYCTTVNEAKFLCKPIVCTDVSGSDEMIVNGETGIICDINAESIFKSIVELSSSDKRTRIINNLENEKNDNQLDYIKTYF